MSWTTNMTNTPETREWAEHLARMAEATEIDAEIEAKNGNLTFARNLRSLADEYRCRAAAIFAKLARAVGVTDGGEAMALIGLLGLAALGYVESWVIA